MPPGRLPGRVSHTSTTPTAALTFSSGAVDGPYTLVSTFQLPVRTSVYTLSSMRAHLRDADTAIAVHHPSPSFHVDGAFTQTVDTGGKGSNTQWVHCEDML